MARFWAARFLHLGVTVVAGAALGGCESGCDQDTLDRATAFVEAHQSCEIDADCVTVGDYCGELPGGWCGQLAMNTEGAASAEWREISNALGGCAPDECVQCDGLLIPACVDRRCGRR